SGAVAVYMSEGEEAARQWLRTEGFQNIDRLNQVLEKTASPWTTKLTLEEA
ncbi:tagatose-bisphosphate aldolase, partial [Streptococcus equi subsp. zooepidemicus]|nr:tagatose-bisphosphate aldolase [Streptococcus equi subsp. zooepidemicus]MDI5930309.1 tagatose-bisphosphate aldolase [Streptococcus equi subsp. zooepidemicus]MDI6029574.1 tagatose-bisphosphate aldolase [Streptococcus equi subsp. zooepidemicus]